MLTPRGDRHFTFAGPESLCKWQTNSNSLEQQCVQHTKLVIRIFPQRICGEPATRNGAPDSSLPPTETRTSYPKTLTPTRPPPSRSAEAEIHGEPRLRSPDSRNGTSTPRIIEAKQQRAPNRTAEKIPQTSRGSPNARPRERKSKSQE